MQAIVGSRSLPHGLVRRAQMILWSEEGMPLAEIGRRLKVTQPAISNWRRRFREQRLSGLHDQLKPGRPHTHNDERIAELLNTALKRRPKAATHWSVKLGRADRRIQEQRAALPLALRAQPHRSKAFKLSTDPFFIEKVRDVVGLYLNPPDHGLVLCVDEKSQVQALERTQPLLPMGLGYVEGSRMTTSPRHHNAVCSLRHRQRSSICPVPGTPPSPGVPELPASSGFPGSEVARAAPHHRQLRHAQARQSKGVARAPSAIPPPLHPDLLVLAQPGRALVRADHATRHPTRLFHLRGRPAPPNRALRERLETTSATLRLDRNCRVDPRQTGTTW